MYINYNIHRSSRSPAQRLFFLCRGAEFEFYVAAIFFVTAIFLLLSDLCRDFPSIIVHFEQHTKQLLHRNTSLWGEETRSNGFNESRNSDNLSTHECDYILPSQLHSSIYIALFSLLILPGGLKESCISTLSTRYSSHLRLLNPSR